MTSLLLSPHQLPSTKVFGEPRLQTDGEIHALTFGPDGSLWSMEEGGVLRHWGMPGGQLLECRSLSDLETLWAFSPDARVLVSGSDDLTLWDVSSGMVLTAVQQPSWVSALAFANDPTHLAAGYDDGTLRYWDLSGHHLNYEFHQHKRPISAVAVSGDGKTLATASEDKTISLWDLAAGKERGTLTGHTDRIPGLAWCADNSRLVSIGWDTTARVWDTQKLQPLFLFNSHAAQVTALAISPQGNLLACADSSFQVHLWDLKTNKSVRVLSGPQGDIRHLAFSRDGAYLACGADRTLHLWETATGKVVAGAGPRAQARTSLAVHGGGKLLATNGGGNNACLYQLPEGKAGPQLPSQDTIHGLAFFPQAATLAGAATAQVRMWDHQGKVQTDLVGANDEAPTTSVAINPDGSLLAAASSSGLDVWLFDAASGEPCLIIPDALDGCTVESLAFHPQGRLLAVGGIDHLATGGSPGAVCLWDVQDRCEINTLGEGCTALAYHPAGALLAVATPDHAILLWNPTQDSVVAELTGHEDAVQALAYSPSGQWLVSGSADRTLRLWDEHGEERAVLEVDSAITGVAFSPDGQSLFTAHANTTCSQYRVAELLRK